MNSLLTYENALRLAGIGHFGLLAASALTPVVLDWKERLQSLPPLLRQLFWVYGAYIVLMIIGLGTFTLMYTEEIASGQAVARSVAVFATVFWGLRLGIQLFVFDPKPFLTNGWLKLGEHVLTATFVFFTIIFAMAAFQWGTGS